MQHVSTYNSHLQAKLRTVNALQGGCAHLGPHGIQNARNHNDCCKSKHVALALYSIVVVLTIIYSNKVNI